MDTRFLNEKLNLPLFMVSRHPLKKEQAQPDIKTYIEDKRKHFLSTWSEDLLKQEDSYSYGKSRHLLGKDRVKPIVKCEHKSRSSAMMSTQDRPWKLAANRYDTDLIPFASRAGRGGAYWHKTHKHKSRKPPTNQPVYRLYDLPRETEKMTKPCHWHKSTFLSNARDRRATTRGMINNPLTSFKDPTFPGPGTYTPKLVEKTYEIHKPSRDTLPYVFYNSSIVPVNKNSIHKPHISFRPGPGRYDIRYTHICPCPSGKQNYPELDLVAERQNRLKFRRLPYKKIKRHLYCAPDWRHVAGKGYPHLFMGARPQIRPLKAAPEAKDKLKQLKLFHDAKYRNMVCNPTNDLGSIRKEPMPQIPTRIKFDRMVKVISRKQLRLNRKLAFGSSAERWKDEDRRPVALTSKQIKELLDRIPPERRFRDYPIMMRNVDEIESKLHHVPEHHLPSYKPKLRKRLFKFLPLPKAKILINDEDIRPKEPSKYGFYFKPLDPKSFYKDKTD